MNNPCISIPTHMIIQIRRYVRAFDNSVIAVSEIEYIKMCEKNVKNKIK